MQNAETLKLEQLGEFLKLSKGMTFTGQDRGEVYAWVERVLVAQEYATQGKKERGVVRDYLAKMTGRSLPQVARLIRSYRETGRVEVAASRRRQFARKYTEKDIALLAEMDRAHERLSGPATRYLLKRAYEKFGEQEYARLAEISVGHLYNLRGSVRYRQQVAVYEPTRATAVSIGERRKPEPQGRPGYLRVDTVHQGDRDGVKGVYHINAVDTVTQWQVVGCVSRISERYLEPVLEAILHQFPFPIVSFHSDNGSEFINRTVEELLNKLLIEFTKSRANRSQDNALVEGKNGAVVRKLIGYGHIAGEHAEALQKFYTAQLNPYLNFHRPCGFATVSVDGKGKRKRLYKLEDYATPYEKLKSLPEEMRKLKGNISFTQLDKQAGAMTDKACGEKMGRAKEKLLRLCKMESPVPPRFL